MANKSGSGSFGEQLKKARRKEKLSVGELAERAKLKASYIAELEAGEALPHVAEIITLSRYLKLDPSSLMGSPQKTTPGRRKIERQTRTDDYAYETLTDEDPDKHMMAFKVTIDPRSDHRKVGYRHDGEEFIYVLSGTLKLTVGKGARTMKAGDSVRFDSGKKHVLKNPGDEPAVLVVVIYTP